MVVRCEKRCLYHEFVGYERVKTINSLNYMFGEYLDSSPRRFFACIPLPGLLLAEPQKSMSFINILVLFQIEH